MCLNCEKLVKNKRNKYCSNKCQREFELLKNPIVEYNVVCSICNKNFKVLERKNSFPSKEKYYCSRSCANSRNWDDEHKRKLSESCRNSEKVKSSFKLWKKKKKDKIEKRCPICQNLFFVLPSNSNSIYCSKECYLNDNKSEYRKGGTGGLREGCNGKRKSGIYKGYYCDSSWELAWVIYNLEHDIKFERNYEKFEYEYKTKKCYYYPDFKIEDYYVEIKGYLRENDELKFKYFPHKLVLLKKEEMIPVLKYVKNKYGKNFINLYENKKIIIEESKNKKNQWTLEEIDYLKQNYGKINKNDMIFLLKRHTINSIKVKENKIFNL